ncbi:MAG: hypothetical protein HXS53_08340 [Theionarchaea archaeon]|nr:hypothetical protein [Theionarchaea archaeon]
MNEELTFENFKKIIFRIKNVKKNMNSPEIDHIIKDFAKFYEIFTLDKFSIDLSTFDMSTHSDIPQKMHKVRERYQVDGRGQFVLHNPGASVGEMHSLYLLDSGMYLLVRTKKIEGQDKQGASTWDWEGALEQYPSMAGKEHKQDIEKILAMIEEKLSDSFLQKLQNMNGTIERDDVDWIVGLLLKKSHLFSTMNHLSRLHSQYRDEVKSALLSFLEKPDPVLRSVILHIMGQLEGPNTLVTLYDSVDDESQQAIVTELQKKSALIPLLKLHDTVSLQGRNVAFLEKTIMNISRFPPGSVDDMIRTLNNRIITPTLAMTVLGTTASKGNQQALEYLLHVYTHEKEQLQKKKLAGEALDRIGKKPKSWREKFF